MPSLPARSRGAEGRIRVERITRHRTADLAIPFQPLIELAPPHQDFPADPEVGDSRQVTLDGAVPEARVAGEPPQREQRIENRADLDALGDDASDGGDLTARCMTSSDQWAC